MKNKNAQITIFVIAALIIIFSFIAYFLISSRISIVPKKISFTNPTDCIKEAVGNASDYIAQHGGFVSAEGRNYVEFNGEKVVFLCYTRDYYKKCIIQEPFFIQHIEKEIEDYAKPRIESCFENLQKEYEKRGYEIERDNNVNVKVNLKPKKIEIEVENKFSIKRGNETKDYSKLKTYINYPLYDLARVAIEIANQEAQYCSFQTIGFMLLYPEIKIKETLVGRGLKRGKIYTIIDKNTNKKMNIAIRSCVIPAGF